MNKLKKVVELKEYSVEELSEEYKELVQNAIQAFSKSHSPYSNFPVGASLLLDNGVLIQGSNQENASYPSGLCAERTALFNYGSNHSEQSIKAMAVAIEKSLPDYAFPCGACLQVMFEYEERQKEIFDVIIVHPDKQKVLISKGLNNLLPFTFKKENLA